MIKQNLILKYRSLADLEKSQTWNKYFKPELLKIKDECSQSEADAQNEFEALKRDIKRSNTIFIINRIIRLVEKSSDKSNKMYVKTKLESNDEPGG